MIDFTGLTKSPTAPTMDAKIKILWLSALRSGVYPQGMGRLRRHDGSFCCLGVLCDAIQGWHRNGPYVGVLSPENETVAGFDNFDTFQLVRMNDSGKSFAEIADYIEETLK